jgi:hypothetical protein
MRKVHWSITATLDYFENIDYLLRDWSKLKSLHLYHEKIYAGYIATQCL